MAVEVSVAETVVVPEILLVEVIFDVPEAKLLLVAVVILPLLDEEVVSLALTTVPTAVLLLLSILLSEVGELNVILVSLVLTKNVDGVEDVNINPIPRFTATVVLVLSLSVNPKRVDEIDVAEVVAVGPIPEGSPTVVLFRKVKSRRMARIWGRR